MATDNKEVAIRKRQQIDSSKKTMFIFVASAAFLAGIALVVSIFLVQQIVFHSKILLEKQNTISRLDKNLSSVDELKKNIRVLDTNTALNSIKSSSERLLPRYVKICSFKNAGFSAVSKFSHFSPRQTFFLSIFSSKFFHKIDQNFNVVFAHGVVNRRPNAA